MYMFMYLTALQPLLSSSISTAAVWTPSYTRTDEATGDTVTCDMCPPGQHLLRHCTKSSRTECGPCPENHYTEIWNYIDRCQYCTRFCTDYETETLACSRENNRRCDCKPGYYMIYGTCSRHSKCPPGEGVMVNGTSQADVKCAPCPDGFFSDEFSCTGGCQQLSVCSSNCTTIPGNDKHDVYCSLCKNGTKTSEEQDLCNTELIEFVARQILPRKKQKRLHVLLKRKNKLSQETSASTLHLLTKVKEEARGTSFMGEVLEILDNVPIPSLYRKVTKWFV